MMMLLKSLGSCLLICIITLFDFIASDLTVRLLRRIYKDKDEYKYTFNIIFIVLFAVSLLISLRF